jgi:hypothetical protein
MSFQAYLESIHSKTGRTPGELLAIAAQKGFAEAGAIRKGVKAGEIVDWLKKDFDLGRGHAMAIVALLKGRKKPDKP